MTHQPAIFCKRTWLFVVLAILPILGMEQLIEHFARQSALEQKRLTTLDSLAILRARLEGLINSHRLLVHGLTAVISAHPDIGQAEFARISHGLVNERHALRNIAGAPDLVISLMYPLAGNEGAIGLNYRTHPIQRTTALRAMRTGQSVLAGPVPLAQGGIGIIIREPVFIGSSQPQETPRFWGIISAVMDIMVFYQESGVLDAGSNLRLALRGTDGTGAAGEIFFGDPHVFASNPVIRDIAVPGGTWQLAAIPRSGWSQPTTTLWLMRVIGLLAALAAGLMITLLVHANELLHRQKQILDRTGRLARVGGWEFEVATLQGTWTDETARIHDLEPGAHPSVSVGLSVFQGPSRAAIEAALHEAIKYARPYDLELEMTTVKGTRKWVRTIGLPVLESGRVARLEGAIQDITDRRQREDEIRQLNAELEERVAARTAELATINKELETFSYSVSHDLKAPLRGIDGYSRLLLEDHLEQLDAEGRLFLANVRQGVTQMNDLIEDLLAYSRMERRGMLGIPVDLAQLIERVLVERGEDINARHGVVRLDLDDELIAQADPDGLAIVLRNLLDNAVKFSRTDRPPEIDIHGKVMEESIILSIQDNGIGFDMQFHDRIFEIFQRLQRAEDYPGTGVGLAMVRKAMLRMGGRVRAESAPGAGATFHLELPR
ncbi:ATP-binding protein [Thiobaca trueperi]|uniref:histidine kinase n=1 Tax=Thiobaca trueperi TaxID=127458 RepID=A0A4R3MXK9_9GAMM|nr:ATP-binding protein [Thiobaca trueperi]TCT21358.1 sensor domain CHASE-containing protein [Thiobaca trueperi]